MEDVLNYILSFGFFIVFCLGLGFITFFLKNYTKAKTYNVLLPVLENILEDFIFSHQEDLSALIEVKLKNKEKRTKDFLENQPFIQDLVEYALKNAPKTIKLLNMNKENLKEKIVSFVCIYLEDKIKKGN